MSSNPRFRIPEQFHKQLEDFIHLESRDAEKLISAIEQTPPTLRKEDFVRGVRSRLDLPLDKVDGLISLLISLYLARADTDLTIHEFVTLIVTAVESISALRGRVSDIEWANFKRNLSTLLSQEQTLGVVSKGAFLQTQHSCLFQEARLFTDLRPVFETQPDKLPRAGLITHELKITYRQGDEVKDFFVAMDSEDIRKLGAVLDRAREKERSLRQLLEKASITIIE